jgi:hypothetical protein
MPRVVAPGSPESGVAGVQSPRTVLGPETVAPAGDTGDEVLSESSVARTWIAVAL